jgi:hypothetical protein
MAKYMINICYGDNERGANPEDNDFIMKKYAEWSEKIREKTLFAHKLKDGEGRRLNLSKDEIVDGPYVESKESVGGFYIVEAGNYDEAVEYAKDCPTLLYQGGFVDIREVEF